MTAEQIKNFREVLVLTLGAYALIMPDEQVVMMRDRFQELADSAVEENEK